MACVVATAAEPVFHVSLKNSGAGCGAAGRAPPPCRPPPWRAPAAGSRACTATAAANTIAMRTDFLRNVIKAPPSKGAQIISAHLVGAPRYICRLAKHEIRGADQAEAGPHEVPVDRLAHVENREGDEYAERDPLLQDLQLGEREGAEAD